MGLSIDNLRNGWTTKWSNNQNGLFKYDEDEVWYRFIKYAPNLFDPIISPADYGKCPVIAMGFVAYLIHNWGESATEIYKGFYELCLSDFMKKEEKLPRAFNRDLKAEYYKKHIEEENARVACSQKIFSYLTDNDCELIHQYVESYFEFIRIEYGNKTLESSKQPEQQSIPEKEVIDLKSQIEQKLCFMQEIDMRKHELILNEADFNKLIGWVTYFFKNNFSLPKIEIPIKEVKTAKGNVIYSFILLYDELHPNATRPDSLFELITKCFYEYRDDTIENLKKSTKKPQFYDDLTKR